MATAYPIEILQPGTKPQDWMNQDLRSQILVQVAKMKLIDPETRVAEPLTQDNILLLNAGNFPRITLTKNSIVQGIPGTNVAGAVISGVGTRITGVRFTQQVVLQSTTRVTFVDCRLDAGAVTQSGAKASFNGCFFANNSFCDNTLGVAANIGILGCTRGSSMHVAVTALFEMVA